MNFESILKSQQEFFKTNSSKDLVFRKTQLLKLKHLLLANEERLSKAIYADFSKSHFDTYTTEISFLYSEIDEAVKSLKKWAKRKKVKTNLVNLPGSSYIIPEPLGVCFIIGAWNYPIQLTFSPLIAAMAAGNTAILKPSKLPQHTSKVITEIINNNFDSGYLISIEGGIAETSKLLELKFDKIFFTGSVPVGKIVYEAAAKNLAPVTLELGGKSPAIITQCCDLKLTAKRLVWGKFLNAGQTCIAPDYVLVDEKIKNEFLSELKQEIKSQNFSIQNGNFVQIINTKNFNRLVNLIDSQKVFDGGKFDAEERIIEPTILHNVSLNDPIMQDEIFGPILPVLTYQSFDDALKIIHTFPKPLASYIFTKDKKLKERFLNEISFGGGTINETLMHIANSNLPFGGVGQSGIGNYHGAFGFATFSHYKSIIEKPLWFEPSLKYLPHSTFKFKLIKWILNK
ncbi:MAG: aldehyde dehydrogenase family protein [Cytophagales bacterium]